MKISKKEYVEGAITTAALENCSTYRDWVMQKAGIDIENSRLHLLCRDNRESFKSIWGKPDFHYNNGEFYFHAWVREYDGETYIVLTAKHKGTCIEIVGVEMDQIEVKAKKIVAFVDNIWKELRLHDCTPKG